MSLLVVLLEALDSQEVALSDRRGDSAVTARGDLNEEIELGTAHDLSADRLVLTLMSEPIL